MTELKDSRFTISIHALREEGDRVKRSLVSVFSVFLSTPSARRATGDVCRLHSCADISIHALREEGDRLQCGTDSA